MRLKTKEESQGCNSQMKICFLTNWGIGQNQRETDEDVVNIVKLVILKCIAANVEFTFACEIIATASKTTIPDNYDSNMTHN